MGLIWIAGALLWGVAEATVFFIVPDVLLTAAVLKLGARDAVKLALIAACGAALGGLALWWWAGHDPASARALMLMVPAVGPDLLARAHREIAGDWPLHLVTGAVTGVPYKLYAVEAGAYGLNPFLFASMTIVARLTRFLFAIALMTAAREILRRMNRPQWNYAVWGAGWISVYSVYFTLRAMA